MTELLTVLLRLAGAGLILLAWVHIPIGRKLRWKEEGDLLSAANRQIFHVHTFFICLVLVLMGLPCLVAPGIFLERTQAGLWLAASLSAFWLIRLYFQFFVYRIDLWRGKRMETLLHWWFSIVWLALTLLFAACGMHQLDWFR